MGISEKKTQIVINNYFKQECDVNTSIRAAFEKGFRIGIKKASSAKPDWIPCNVRLPEKDDFVLVTISGVTSNGKSWEHTMTLAVWTGDSWDLVDADMADFRIFAWRPLPEPYTEEEA